MKHIHVSTVQTVVWECDHCGANFQGGKKAPPRCYVCSKDLCKRCKRHIHVETGTGTGAEIPNTANVTRSYCPECFAPVADVVLDAVKVSRG